MIRDVNRFRGWKVRRQVATESTAQRKQRNKCLVVEKSRSNQLVAQIPERGEPETLGRRKSWVEMKHKIICKPVCKKQFTPGSHYSPKQKFRFISRQDEPEEQWTLESQAKLWRGI